MKRITDLNQTVLECMNAKDERFIIRKFVQVATSILSADYGYGYLLGSNKKHFSLLYKTPTTPYTPKVPRVGGTVSSTFKSRQPRLIIDVRNVSGVRSDAKDNMRGVAVIPITYKNRNYGAMVICYKDRHDFTEADKSLCSVIGNTAAQAITIHRLYSNLKDFKNTLDGTMDSIVMFDPVTLRVLYVNEGAVKLAGYTRKELMSKSFFDLQTSYTKQSFAPLLESLVIAKVPSELFETQLVRHNKKKIPTEFFLQYVVLKDQPPRLLSIIRDISERKKAEESIRYNAYHDTLTNLPNRIYFTEQFETILENAKAERKPLAVLFIDLDRFKFINDVLGHMIGDKLLAEVAKRLQSCVGHNDIISRMGGDEFVILLGGLSDDQEALDVARQVLDSFKKPFIVDSHEVFVNISIGMSAHPLDGKDMISLLKNADSALQRAKEQGGSNYQQYHTGISVPDKMHLELEKQLRKAIERDELVVHYQPQIDTVTGSMVSCEALVRWEHPKLGLIFPDQFINYAEDSGLIVPMGEWVLRRACSQVHEWNSLGGKQVTLTVNLSPRQLLQQNLVENVSRILKETGLTASQLELEITERLIMKNIDVAIEILQQFKDMGIKLSVDDFGTGYASLSYLRKLPIDILKIDRSFIHGSLENIQDAAIITAIITIAHQLGLKVVAEGVETKKQLEFLKSQHCDIIQGNLFSKALPEAEFAAQFIHNEKSFVARKT